ncbi:glycosyltransferase family 2 protein [Methylobacterium sp. J-076]|uniref:glycosyltransferase family 2 protein n=1 Tax=Methylobacterium sp. J-076 TaxID=2836655 RepID=UPI001FBA383B|nr:glycosyltransferase [Methylobacterium sp. J-076]MCJ2011953.1 glycosyltransferase [Methylobacterium sp. J-076]
MRRPVVHLYTVCWDEADMLGFFFRHYDPWVDRYVVYDDGSTDGSRDILRAHPRVELRDFSRDDPDSFVLSHRTMQNEAWKESRHRADWIVVTAIDEHLHVPGHAMAEYLADEADRGVTLIPALGFDLNHPEMPEDAGLLTGRVTRGRPRIAFNKLSLFKPEALRETGFGPGRHAATPAGDLRLPARDSLVLWHYKHLGFARNAAREAAQADRLGRTDRAEGFGQHYLWGREKLRAFWDEMERDSRDLVGAVPDALAIRPLWWEEQGLRRAEAAPLAPLTPAVPGAPPTVSVLVKSYQHAPYVRQTIESVLAQSFQDFEIVVTDDGSTDGTAEILRGFTDSRIRLECWPENRGISAAMNATVARARGRYLAILNSDDWALPGRLRRQVGFLDTHPEVGLVFGMPRAVDEAGLPTDPFNDFTEPLRFGDFSRRTWLRQFFFRYNVLCAPSAMIRREAYAAAGPYDPRLTNLQDFEMWIRMLIAGQAIHVLPDRLTAFRIRADNANTSAPSPEARLRSPFEHAQVLRRFTEISEDLFAEVFDAAEDVRPGEPMPVRIAHLARPLERIEHRSFALQTLFEAARTPQQLADLRDWGGSLDALNLRALEGYEAWNRDVVAAHDLAVFTRDRATAEAAEAAARHTEEATRHRDEAARHREELAGAEDRLARSEEGRAGMRAELDGLDARLRASLLRQREMENSLGWRAAQAVRRMGRLFRR